MSDMKRREMLRITAVAGLGLAFGGGVVAELLRRGALHRVRGTRVQLGTIVRVNAVHPDAAGARAMLDAVFAEIERLESILSRHREGTPLARLNLTGELVEAPEELLEVLGQALVYARVTGGAFDPTVAPLLTLYGERVRGRGAVPTDAEVRGALTRVDHRAVRIDGSRIRLELPRMALTLDGIAKGYVADRAAAALLAAGAERVVLDAGGDMTSRGAGEPWRVAIQDPRDPARYVATLHLAGGGLATSGDYVQAFTEDRKHHHIVDPRTGRSPVEASSVTVLAPSGMPADALATAVMVLGPREGLTLLAGLEGVEGYIVAKEGTRTWTPGFPAQLDPHA